MKANSPTHDLTSDTAATLVRRFEGCRLAAYQDGRGIWTIGWGHSGPDVTMGGEWTQAQADTQLAADLLTAEDALARLVTVPLAEGQAGALVSMIFNLGPNALAGSKLILSVNARDWIDAAHQMIRWDHQDGAESTGLLIRRLAEATAFLESSSKE
ncbi:MAG: lysozyme [Rhizomicrobium sp.]